MAKQVNYKKLFTVQQQIEKELKQICPSINHKSGIYFLLREDKDANQKFAYIGKGVDLCRRMISHRQGYSQRIDISIKKRGWYSPQNEGGWKLHILNFPEDKLNEKERYYIKKYQLAGYDLYNIENGGAEGKEDINERKSGKGYRDGISQGKKTLSKELLHIIDKHLVITLKKETKISQKALEKFYSLLLPKDAQVEETDEN